MLESAVHLLRDCGAAHVTIGAVITHSKSPRGSVYHHFPHGRNQILAEALERAGTVVSSSIETAHKDGATAVLDTFITLARANIPPKRGADLGAVIAVASEAGADADLAEQAAAIIALWTSLVAASLEAQDVGRKEATHFATRAMATIVGVVVLSRTSDITTPLDDIAAELTDLLPKTLSTFNTQ